jgi:hypothetical protein
MRIGRARARQICHAWIGLQCFCFERRQFPQDQFLRAKDQRRKTMGLLNDVIGMAGLGGGASAQSQQHAGALGMLLEYMALSRNS